MSTGKVGKNRVNGIARSFPARYHLFLSFRSVSAITIACAMEAVSIITLDGIINVYTDVYTYASAWAEGCVLRLLFFLAAADAMPAFLEIQLDVCVTEWSVTEEREEGELENTAKGFHTVGQLSYFPSIGRIAGRCPW